jgi:hypothetical protein
MQLDTRASCGSSDSARAGLVLRSSEVYRGTVAIIGAPPVPPDVSRAHARARDDRGQSRAFQPQLGERRAGRDLERDARRREAHRPRQPRAPDDAVKRAEERNRHRERNADPRLAPSGAQERWAGCVADLNRAGQPTEPREFLRHAPQLPPAYLNRSATHPIDGGSEVAGACELAGLVLVEGPAAARIAVPVRAVAGAIEDAVKRRRPRTCPDRKGSLMTP